MTYDIYKCLSKNYPEWEPMYKGFATIKDALSKCYELIHGYPKSFKYGIEIRKRGELVGDTVIPYYNKYDKLNVLYRPWKNSKNWRVVKPDGSAKVNENLIVRW